MSWCLRQDYQCNILCLYYCAWQNLIFSFSLTTYSKITHFFLIPSQENNWMKTLFAQINYLYVCVYINIYVCMYIHTLFVSVYVFFVSIFIYLWSCWFGCVLKVLYFFFQIFFGNFLNSRCAGAYNELEVRKCVF